MEKSRFDDQLFIEYLFNIKAKYYDELKAYGNKKTQKILTAINSLKSFLPYLFTHNEHPNKNIPNTNNFLEGAFSHIKEKLNLHRGLNTKRKKKAFHFLASKHPKSLK